MSRDLASLGDYRVTFGQFYGKRLHEIPLAELRPYVAWLETATNGLTDPRIKIFVETVKEYLTREGRTDT